MNIESCQGPITFLSFASRLNPTGYGRNMSLFLVMKRYDDSLRNFLDEQGRGLGWRTSLVLLTQLLEGSESIL
jgi:hypothetical protein